MLDDADVARVREFCDVRVPAHARHQVHLEVEQTPQALTIVECRAPWREDFGPAWTRRPIARLRYTTATQVWTLYCRERNGRWQPYPVLPPTPDLDELIAEIDRDPICIFWG